MKSVITSMKNMHWNRIVTVALPISILYLAQACAPHPGRANNDVNPASSVAEISVTSPVNNVRN
ncbi:hypothetical protein RIVM261_019580 [Rivularia sp. IAM M-261]|nr:hypothetical protein CAL7716_027720 [Calothrix sp. PCC 7716]GJD17002.1 hypothetical protein RIVM261_019580 [Rivularia sp. IAM M-261]